MIRGGRSVPKSVMYDEDIGELRRLIGLIGADVSARGAIILEFIRSAMLAGKSPTEIVTVLKAHVFPLKGDSLKREDLLPAYVRLGLIGRPRVEHQKQESILGVVANILKKFN